MLCSPVLVANEDDWVKYNATNARMNYECSYLCQGPLRQGYVCQGWNDLSEPALDLRVGRRVVTACPGTQILNKP